MTSKIVTEPTVAEIKARYLAWNASGNEDDFCFPRIACGILLDMLDKYEEEINKYHQAGVDLLREKRAAEKVIKDWGLENADSEEAQSWRQRAMGAEQTVEKLRQGIQAYLDGDYDNPASHRYDNLSLNKYSGCEHGEPYYKECTICDDAYFSKLLEDSA